MFWKSTLGFSLPIQMIVSDMNRLKLSGPFKFRKISSTQHNFLWCSSLYFLQTLYDMADLAQSIIIRLSSLGHILSFLKLNIHYWYDVNLEVSTNRPSNSVNFLSLGVFEPAFSILKKKIKSGTSLRPFPRLSLPLPLLELPYLALSLPHSAKLWAISKEKLT